MKSGVIGKITGKLKEIESYGKTREEGDFELKRQLEFRTKLPGPGDSAAHSGRAAIERVEETKGVQFRDNEILVSDSKEKVQLHTNFLLVPDSFMIVESGRGEFAFNLVEGLGNIEIERATIDLLALLEYCSEFDPDPWQVGFFGNEGNAEKGVVYGEEILTDSKIGEMLRTSKMNQIGLRFTDHEGTNVKFTATKSGFVQIYQPQSYDEIDLMRFVDEFILPYLLD